MHDGLSGVGIVDTSANVSVGNVLLTAIAAVPVDVVNAENCVVDFNVSVGNVLLTAIAAVPVDLANAENCVVDFILRVVAASCPVSLCVVGWVTKVVAMEVSDAAVARVCTGTEMALVESVGEVWAVTAVVGVAGGGGAEVSGVLRVGVAVVAVVSAVLVNAVMNVVGVVVVAVAMVVVAHCCSPGRQSGTSAWEGHWVAFALLGLRMMVIARVVPNSHAALHGLSLMLHLKPLKLTMKH